MTAASGDPDERTALERMLEARSVAVVGASVKEGSLGRQMMLELLRGGFDGAIYPVNPGYDDVLGHRCYPSIADVPGSVDLAILGVANHRIEQALGDAVAAGARSAVTFSSLYEAEPPRPGMPPLTERVATIARDAGIAMCGGNGMGFLSLDADLRATGFATPDHIRRGPVALVSHSGSAFAALAFNDRGIGFNVIVSSGQELVTDVADYMSYALAKASTHVIALLIETIRRPDAFRAALASAADADVPVIALKVGRTERSKSMVTAHSGALAGEDGAYEALFEAYGVVRVATLDEMADAMELFSSPRRVTTGGGIASIHDSGGERVLFVDVAADLGVPFATDLGGDDRAHPGGAGSRAGGGEPPRRVGDRHRRRPHLHRVLPRAARRPRRGRARVRGGHDAAGRAVRRRVPPRGARGVQRRPRSRSASCRTWRAPSRTTRRRSCATTASRCSREPRPA